MSDHNMFLDKKLGKLSLNHPYYPFLSEALVDKDCLKEEIFLWTARTFKHVDAEKFTGYYN